MKNPFKKQSIIDTAINVGIGGGANVAMDYVFNSVDALASIAEYKNWIKIGVGVLGGTMVSNKWARAAADGIATVGVSELVAGLIPSATSGDASGSAGLPAGTIGAIRRRTMGQRNFINRRQVAGVGVPATAVVSK